MTEATRLTVANETLHVLTEFYPSYINYVPKEVLQFGFPNPIISAMTSTFTGILSIISLTGNLTIILVYFRYKCFNLIVSGL